MPIFLRRLFAFKDEEVNIVFYLILSFVFITLAYDYAYIKFEKMDSIITMVYYNVVTASTVGYGDFSPQTFEGKLITIIYIPIAISLFAAMLSVMGAIMYGNITKKQRGIKFINRNIDFLIIGGYKTKINNLVDDLCREGKKVAVLNDLYESIPYEYKKDGVRWVKGGHAELKMFNHDKIEQYIVLSNDPTNFKSDITNNFIVEKIIQSNNGKSKILVEVLDKEKYIQCESARFMDIAKANLIAREALVPNSTLAVEAVLDNSKAANQINIIIKEDMTIAEIANNLCPNITKGSCCPIGYLYDNEWVYIPVDKIKSNHTKLEAGIKVKFLIEGEIEDSFTQAKKEETILIMGHEPKRVKKLINNYLLDSRFSDTKFFCNIDVKGTILYDIEDENSEKLLEFTKIAILSNLFEKDSDEENFHLWGLIRKGTPLDTKILIEMTDEKHRNTLKDRYEDTYNQFITYSNTGLLVQELQDSGFAKLLEDDTEKCIEDINAIIKRES